MVTFSACGEQTSLWICPWNLISTMQTCYSWFCNMPPSLKSTAHRPKAKTFLRAITFIFLFQSSFLFSEWVLTYIPAVTDESLFCSKQTQYWILTEQIWPLRAWSKHSQQLLSGCDAWGSVSDVWIRPSRLPLILHVQKNNVIRHTFTHIGPAAAKPPNIIH